MKWIKIDHYTGKPVAHNSGWHIVDYVSGDFKITQWENGKRMLWLNGKNKGTFNTLRDAKSRAEEIARENS